MNDRFKFRVWNKEQQKLYSWDDLKKSKGDNSFYWCMLQAQNDEKNNILMQCTGMKDKNGKLIYEGDIVKYAEFDWTDFSIKNWETEKAQVIYGAYYDNYYPAFDLKDTDFDGTNAFSYIFNEGWTIEVIGNIYENKELLENTDER